MGKSNTLLGIGRETYGKRGERQHLKTGDLDRERNRNLF